MVRTSKNIGFRCVPLIIVGALGACDRMDRLLFIQEAQEIAAATCQFVPTISTVTGLANSLSDVEASNDLAVALQVADIVCDAILEQGSDRGIALPRVNNIDIRGYYTD